MYIALRMRLHAYKLNFYFYFYYYHYDYIIEIFPGGTFVVLYGFIRLASKQIIKMNYMCIKVNKVPLRLTTFLLYLKIHRPQCKFVCETVYV